MKPHVPKPGTTSFVYDLSDAWIAHGIAGLVRVGAWSTYTATRKLFRLRIKHGKDMFPYRLTPDTLLWTTRALECCEDPTPTNLAELTTMLRIQHKIAINRTKKPAASKRKIH